MNRKKNEVDLEHNSPHASGVFGRKITGEDDLSHHVQGDQMRGMEIVVNDVGVEVSSK